jgi:regulator of sirC expression with transglutaminase-like and TPR domain
MARLRDSFAALVASGDECDLARGALEIARIAYPDLEAGPWLRRLDALAAAVRPRLAGLPVDRATLELSAYLFDECGYRGDTDNYYDPRNSFLNDVLDRRLGIPISLAVLLIEVAGRLGLPIEGVGFPGHFLARARTPGGPLVLDPFSGGRVLDTQELGERLRAFQDAAAGSDGARHGADTLAHALRASGRIAILSRMLANLLHIYVQRDDAEHALEASDLFLVLSPDAHEPLRVRGLLYERLGCDQSALSDLRRYLELVPSGSVADDVRERVARLTTSARTLH